MPWVVIAPTGHGEQPAAEHRHAAGHADRAAGGEWRARHDGQGVVADSGVGDVTGSRVSP